ncbi:MAG: DinB family protein [Terriglobus sp.]
MMRAQASAPTIQAAYAADADKLSSKFAGLAGAMSGKYDWKPGQGVRSVGEVFNLIVLENGMLARVLTGAATPAGRPAPITDPQKLQDALKSSYTELEAAINGLSEADLKAPVKLFGRDMTKQAAIMLLIGDQHEHLGQSIAYARSNGVVPPWSK